MRVEIIEVEAKKNRITIIVIFILTLLLMVLLTILGIRCAATYQKSYVQKNRKNITSIRVQKNNEIKYENKNKNEIIVFQNQEKNESEKIVDKQEENESKIPISEIYNKETKIAYLTFDDGPSQAVTPLILDVLKEEGIKATFFVLGANVKNNPELLRRAYDEGHYIANHGYYHDYKRIYKNAQSVLEEYRKTEKVIKETLKNDKYKSNLFRFPGGYLGGKYEKVKQKAGKLLKENNIEYIDWNVLTGDAEGANTKEKILKNIEKHTKDKGNIVVLMHDASSKILTYETLKDVINYLREQGYIFDNFYNVTQ